MAESMAEVRVDWMGDLLVALLVGDSVDMMDSPEAG